MLVSILLVSQAHLAFADTGEDLEPFTFIQRAILLIVVFIFILWWFFGFYSIRKFLKMSHTGIIGSWNTLFAKQLTFFLLSTLAHRRPKLAILHTGSLMICITYGVKNFGTNLDFILKNFYSRQV